jgi:hypothetical protein
MRKVIITSLILLASITEAQEVTTRKFTIQAHLGQRYQEMLEFQPDRNNPWGIHDQFDKQFKLTEGNANEKALVAMFMDYLTDCEISTKVKKSGGKCLLDLKRYHPYERVVNVINTAYKENADREALIPAFMCAVVYMTSNNETDLMACTSAFSKKEKIEYANR